MLDSFYIQFLVVNLWFSQVTNQNSMKEQADWSIPIKYIVINYLILPFFVKIKHAHFNSCDLCYQRLIHSFLTATYKSPSADLWRETSKNEQATIKHLLCKHLLKTANQLWPVSILSLSSHRLYSSNWPSVASFGWLSHKVSSHSVFRQAIAFTPHLTTRSLSGHRAVCWVLPFHQ